MQLNETFEEVYRKANEERIPKKLYHKGNPYYRDDILKNGLIPKIGDSYRLFITDSGRGDRQLKDEELQPMVFLYDADVFEYDSTWDDDKYEINTDLLDKSLFRHDVLSDCYTYSDIIPPKALKLIYKGTGETT